MVKLLDAEAIPFHKTGSHRRLLLDDVLAYDAQRSVARKAGLRDLAEQAQALDLSYE